MSKGIKIIGDEERQVFGNLDVDGYEIGYRRVPESISKRIIKRHTKFHRKRGDVVDWSEVGTDILEYMILDWKGVVGTIDGKEQEIPVNPENIARLPGDITGELIDLSGANSADGKEEDRGNSAATSDSNQ